MPVDVLSSVMRELHFVGAGFRQLQLTAPWAISFGQRGVRGIHIVTSGRCELSFEHGVTQVLEAGDLVITPRADPHVLRSLGSPQVSPVSASELAASSSGGRVRLGGTGDEAVIVCGAFVFRDVDHPALPGLPRMVRVPGDSGRPTPWLRGYIDVLLGEALDGGPGSEVVLARLSAALITRTLRHAIDDADQVGWLKALRDPGIARALAVVHDNCREPWTVESLARIAGLSRAAFAARFHALVGETPMRYLFSRRMRQAIALLSDRRLGLAKIAVETGYQSEAAFSAAFKRHTCLSPGEYRNRMFAAVPVRGPDRPVDAARPAEG